MIIDEKKQEAADLWQEIVDSLNELALSIIGDKEYGEYDEE